MPAPIFTCLRKPVKSIFGCMITVFLAISGLIEPHAVATSIVILSNSKQIWVAADMSQLMSDGVPRLRYIIQVERMKDIKPANVRDVIL
jgi:hypothetical protein